ncbi:ABC-2 type transport system ATP-binding protein [Actinomyces ruminicola]|uniref:ABC-2 type transport system ATP-binding protein n=1 Tax=Actinomyces ruminicola TaxID=332524 RepID=A0A1G9ZVY5_9ACTO|nr:ATP-binding cassette domain-containing protein [Actinomyces ruminicola]SDN25257.1 ABC-2 type transport system ATP-binding protein [Actinomyces ruminicola]
MNAPQAPTISFRELRMEFPRRRSRPLVALDSLTLDVGHGQVFGLLGPNGSGKTTSVNLLCGLLRPTGGTVLVEGIDVRTDVTGVRTHLGVVPQETALYNDLSAEENLAFHARLYGVPRAQRRNRINEVLELVGLAERRGDRVGTYSGGMQRRLALARALLTRPGVVVLDEPTLGVDVQSRAALWDRVRRIAADGGTVLLTTNYMEEAQALADNLAILDHGLLIATGTPEELRGRLGRTFIDVRTARPDPALARLPGVVGVSWHDGVASVAADGSPATIRTLLDRLTEQDPDALLVGVRRPDLNDVFLSLTGTALRDRGQA